MRILVPVDGSENSLHAVEFLTSRTTLNESYDAFG